MFAAQVEHDEREEIVALLADHAGDDLRAAQFQGRARLAEIEHGAQLLVLPLHLAQAEVLHQQRRVDLVQLRVALTQGAQFQQEIDRVGDALGEAGGADLGRRRQLCDEALHRLQTAGQLQRHEQHRAQGEQEKAHTNIAD